jgi:hypothetical protein
MIDVREEDAISEVGTGLGGTVIAFSFQGFASSPSAGIGAIPDAMITPSMYMASRAGQYAVGLNASPAWLNDLIPRLERLSILEAGWDGYRARPIERNPLLRAWNFIKQIAPHVRVPPAMVPTVSGGVALEWHRNGIEIEIEFAPNRTATVSFEDDEGHEYEGALDKWAPRVVSTLVNLV